MRRPFKEDVRGNDSVTGLEGQPEIPEGLLTTLIQELEEDAPLSSTWTRS